MRSYAQYCGVARALDVVGDRWSLLVVRELLVRPCRFTDLLTGLPGVPRNLLTSRLRSLEAAGIVAREDDRYVATERGRELRPVLRELIRWSLPLMVEGPGEDAVRDHWIGHAAEALYAGADLEGLEGLRIAVESEAGPLSLCVRGGRLRAEPGTTADADVTLRGPMHGIMAALVVGPENAPADARPLETAGRTDRLAVLRERRTGVAVP